MTTPTDADRAGSVRRRHLRERQAAVFGLLIAVLAFVGLGSAAIYTGAVSAPFSRDFTTSDPNAKYAGIKVPCLPNDKVLPVALDKITLNIYNATDRLQLGSANRFELIKRGYAPAVVRVKGNLEAEARTLLRFGANGVAAAYTTSSWYADPVLILDDRADASVDLVLGADFVNLTPEEDGVLDPKQPLTDRRRCTKIEKITPQKAPTPSPPAAKDAKPAG